MSTKFAKHYWNYVNVFSYALALTETQDFTADPEQWYVAVDELRKEFVKEWPEAFRSIYFERPPGLPLYSPQIEHLRHVLAQGGELSAPNPAYVVLQMNQAQRNSIIRQNEERLADKKELIRKMGERLKELLACEE